MDIFEIRKNQFGGPLAWCLKCQKPVEDFGVLTPTTKTYDEHGKVNGTKFTGERELFFSCHGMTERWYQKTMSSPYQKEILKMGPEVG